MKLEKKDLMALKEGEVIYSVEANMVDCAKPWANVFITCRAFAGFKENNVYLHDGEFRMVHFHYGTRKWFTTWQEACEASAEQFEQWSKK